jgi:hypothetical protein
VRYPLGERLRLADQGRQALPQVGDRHLVEAVVDLAGVDEVVAPAPADVKSVPFASIERKSGDRKVSRCAQVFLT